MKYTPVFALCLFSLMSCAKTEIAVWSRYPEFEALFTAAGEGHKKIALDYRVPPDKGDSVPGIYILDGRELNDFIAMGLALDMTDKQFLAGLEQDIVFPPFYYYKERNYGFFLNSGNGVLCYDPGLTEKYLQASQPGMVQELFGDLNSFIAAACLVSRKSFGSCAILPDVQELLPAFRNTKTLPYQKGEIGGAETEKWFADVEMIFNDRSWAGLMFENGRPRKTAAFFLPPGSFWNTVGLRGKTQPEEQAEAGKFPLEQEAADWRIIAGPDPESSGGIWLALHRDFFSGKKRENQKKREYLGLLFTR